MTSASSEDHMGLNVGESTLQSLDEFIRISPSSGTRAQVTVMEHYLREMREVLDMLGIGEDYSR